MKINFTQKVLNLLALYMLFLTTSNAKALNNPWRIISAFEKSAFNNSQIKQDNPVVWQVNFQTLQNELMSLQSDDAQLHILLPMPDGTVSEFVVKKSSIMEKELQEKYAMIQTFEATNVNNPGNWGRLDISPYGFHGQFYFDGDMVYIDPFSKSSNDFYIAYLRSSFYQSTTKSRFCEVEKNSSIAVPDLILNSGQGGKISHRSNGAILHQFRLALACTFEYSTAVGGSILTKASVLAAMVTSVNRVNTVYANDLSCKLILIANTDTLIYLTSTDPYSNNNGNQMLGQNQTTINNLIGAANYDIGHVFSTGGGGIAYLGSLCSSSSKARGVTGSSSPVGDPFDIDYVAHEVGHQFGADHTFNSNLGSCSGNGESTNAFEPGSGSTIMAYAGICGGDNIQLHSDPFFHFASLNQIYDHLNTVSSCGTAVATNNSLPTTSVPTNTFSIPLNTAFEFENTGTDNNDTNLTYTWEQADLGGFGQNWNTNFGVGPMYKSFNPSNKKFQSFPSDIRAYYHFYYLDKANWAPTVARTLSFYCTVRDNHAGSGGVFISNNPIQVNVVNTLDTFKITNPSVSETWTGGGRKKISWRVAGTNSNGINTTMVDLYYTIDTGKTWILLQDSIPNIGFATIDIPNINAAALRIKLKGTGNVFYDICRNNIKIVASTIGINALQIENRIDIFPNPADNILNISIQNLGFENPKLIIYNVLGQEVYKTSMIREKESIDVKNFFSGIYQIVLVDNQNTILAKGKWIKL